jgi:uncharacterized membrane protein YhaH (DUF805 family)
VKNFINVKDFGDCMVSAVKSAYSNYAVFQGRATRSEFWLFQLAFALFFFGVGLILTFGSVGMAAATVTSGDFNPLLWFILLIWFITSFVFLFSVIPAIALTVRRLHDANLSAWWLGLAFVPVIGGLALLVMTLLPSSSYGNRYDNGYSASGAASQSTRYGGDSNAGTSTDLF